jgi:hypothetical protein
MAIEHSTVGLGIEVNGAVAVIAGLGSTGVCGHLHENKTSLLWTKNTGTVVPVLERKMSH